MPEKWLICLLAVLVGIFLWLLVRMVKDSNRFVVVKYKIESPKLERKCRAVMLSDLHDKEYGKGNERLLRAVDEANPELILIAGDMVTSGGEKTDWSVALKLLEKLSKKYPVYYAMGNHEYRMKVYRDVYGKQFEEYIRKLKKMGVRILENEKVYLPKLRMEICGLEIDRSYYKRFRHKAMPENYMKQLLGESREDCLELLIAHNPDYFKEYAQWGADITVSGHVHGGVVRLPLLGGVISPMVHFFPKYDGGRFEEYGKVMILGRGLGMHTIPVRLFNPGEVVVLDLEPSKE